MILTKKEIEALIALLSGANVKVAEAAFAVALLEKLQGMFKEAE